MAVFAALAVAGTLFGHGPFRRASTGDSLLVLDAVLASLACTCLCLAALVRQLEATAERWHAESDEHARAEAALQQSELRLRLMAEIIEGYSFGYAVTPDRRVQLDWLSHPAEKILGYTEAELKTTVKFRDCIHPDDRQAQQAALDAVLAGIPEIMEFRFLTKSGTWRWLQCFNRPEWDAAHERVVRILGAGQDVTESKQAEQKLHATERALRDSVENTPNVCVQWFTEDGRLLFWNHASEQTYGWTRAEALGRQLSDVGFTVAQNQAFLSLLQQIKNTGQSVGPLEFPFHRRDGRSGICLSTLFTIPAPEGGQIFVCTDIDITDLRTAQNDREQLITELLRTEDAERRRIARELHDSTAQQLAALKLNLVQLQKNSPTTAASLADSVALTEAAIQEIRTFTWLLHPPLLEELGLARALQDYADGYTRRTGITAEVQAGNFVGRLPAAQELALFRVAQESLTNILRHSGSRTALVRLERDAEQVRLEIQDSGHGLPGGKIKPGVGINGMKERLRIVGGTLEIESDAEGTTLLATLPIDPETLPA
jgi:PAS domain S-box-containing protein